MTPFRVLAGLVLLITGTTSYLFLGGAGIDGVAVASFLFDNGAVLYGVGVVWIVAAPLPLVIAAVVAGRTPWPWVAAVTLHLAVLLVLLLRLRNLVPGAAFLGLGCFAVIGLMSVLAVVFDRQAVVAPSPRRP